jgi:hypothetical protein
MIPYLKLYSPKKEKILVPIKILLLNNPDLPQPTNKHHMLPNKKDNNKHNKAHMQNI